MQERPPQHAGQSQAQVSAAPGIRHEFRLGGQVLGIIAVLALSFLVELTLLGNLRHDRDQAQLAAEFRIQLAQPTAPVGPLDETSKPLAAGIPVALLEIPRLGLREAVVEGSSSARSSQVRDIGATPHFPGRSAPA
jgi:sortase A